MREHKRKNLQDAFVGEADPLSEGIHADPDAPESVEFKIKSGLLRAQVPADTETPDVLGPDRYYEADLVLEDGTRVAIQIAQGAEGVNMLVDGRESDGLSAAEATSPPDADRPTAA